MPSTVTDKDEQANPSDEYCNGCGKQAAVTICTNSHKICLSCSTNPEICLHPPDDYSCIYCGFLDTLSEPVNQDMLTEALEDDEDEVTIRAANEEKDLSQGLTSSTASDEMHSASSSMHIPTDTFLDSENVESMPENPRNSHKRSADQMSMSGRSESYHSPQFQPSDEDISAEREHYVRQMRKEMRALEDVLCKHVLDNIHTRCLELKAGVDILESEFKNAVDEYSSSMIAQIKARYEPLIERICSIEQQKGVSVQNSPQANESDSFVMTDSYGKELEEPDLTLEGLKRNLALIPKAKLTFSVADTKANYEVQKLLGTLSINGVPKGKVQPIILQAIMQTNF